jgi:hypothetical protein
MPEPVQPLSEVIFIKRLIPMGMGVGFHVDSLHAQALGVGFGDKVTFSVIPLRDGWEGEPANFTKKLCHDGKGLGGRLDLYFADDLGVVSGDWVRVVINLSEV